MAPINLSRSGVGLACLLSPDPSDLISAGFKVDIAPVTGLQLSAAVAAAQLALTAAADAAGVHRLRAAADAWSPAAALPSDPFSSSSSASGGGCPLGFTSAAYKQYPSVHVPSTLTLLTPRQLLWLFLKNSGIVLLLQTNGWLYQALEAEEAAVQQGTQAQLPPFPSVLQSLVKAAWQSWRELLTRITRSEIRHWVRASASSRVAWKVLKDPRESVTGKATFYLNVPAVRLLPMYSVTMFRTQLPTYAAEFLVACGYDAIADLGQLVRAPQKQLQPQQQQAGLLASLQSLQQQAAQRVQQLVSGQISIDWVQLPPASKSLGIKAAKHLVRVSGTAVFAALGAGVAGAVAPRESAGVWAFRGLLVTDLIVANILGFMLDGPLAGAFGDAAAAAQAEVAQQQQQRHLPPHAGEDMLALFRDMAH